jgi:hypothetical protein
MAGRGCATFQQHIAPVRNRAMQKCHTWAPVFRPYSSRAWPSRFEGLFGPRNKITGHFGPFRYSPAGCARQIAGFGAFCGSCLVVAPSAPSSTQFPSSSGRSTLQICHLRRPTCRRRLGRGGPGS